MLLNIYLSKADYNNATNPWQQLTVPAHGRQALSMVVGTTYYVDWYSASDSYTNWIPSAGSTSTSVNVAKPAPELTIAGAPQTIGFSEAAPNHVRYITMPNNSTSSTWKVVGRYMGISAPLGPAPYGLVTFNKDFRSTITYTNNTNDTTTVTGQMFCYNPSPQSDFLSLYISTPAGQDMAQFLYDPGSVYPWSYSRDTINCTMFVFNNSYNYVIVRQ